MKFLYNFSIRTQSVKLIFAFLFFLGAFQNADAQTNVGLAAVSTHSGGGASASGYGPELYNNGVIMGYNVGGTYNWGWVTSNGWIEYTWTTPQTIGKVVFYEDNRPFTSLTVEYWNGVSYTTVQTGYTGTAGTEDSITFSTPFTTTKLRFNSIAGSNPNFREIQVFARPTSFNDAGVLSIDSPSTFCGGVQTIKATIKNYGKNQINPVTVNWSLNGTAQSSFTYTSILDTLGTVNNTARVTLGTYTFPSTPPTVIKAWTSSPNNVADTVKLNDSATVIKAPSISGSYTINPSGSGSTNFTSFTAAATALNVAGVCGPVYFTVSPGTYTEKVTLTNVIGTSATNTITFDGVDSSTRILTFNETTTAANIGVFNLIGTSYVTIKNLRIVNTGVTYGAGVSIQNGSNFNTVTKCRINVAINATSTYIYGVGVCGLTISTTSIGANNTISNCKIVGGYACAALYGVSTASFINGNNILSCDLSGGYLYGIYDYYQNLNSINDNRILLSSSTNSYGIYTYYCQNNTIDRNIVVAAYMGMYIYNNNNAGSTRMSCSNNIINMNGPYIYSTNYGFYALYNVNGDFFHNTVYTAPTVASGYCAYLGYGSGCAFKNNIFHSTNAGMYAIYCPSITFTVFDHNIIYAPGANYVYWGTALYGDLAALKAAAGTFHQKSLSKIPNYVSLANKLEDFHLTTTVPADYGDGAYTKPTDVDNESRCQFAPTIGADESKFGSGAPTANYTEPDSIFVSSPVTILNNAAAGAPLGHKWYIDGVYRGNTLNLPYLFTTTGTYVVKLVTQGCFGTDSITKTLTVYNPTQKPIANFISDLNTVETYQNVSFRDLTTKGPTYWYWTFSPSSGVNYTLGTTNTSQNPVVNFANPGLYTVCMWDSNALGRSNTVCKTAYVLVKATSQMCIFPFDTKVGSGTLYDDGGPNGNYGANHTAANPCNFLIDPCASSVTLSFSSFNLGTGALLKVYNGKDKLAPALHTGTGFTGASIPPNLVATSGKMFIEFITATTLASGFAASWTSVGGSFGAPAGNNDVPDTLYDCGALTDMSFVPSNPAFEKDGAYYKWYFDYANSNSFADFEGKGAYQAQWSYGSTGSYIIRCEIEGCGGTLITMDTVIVDHPTSGPLMDFKADLTTATPSDVVTLSDQSKYDPYYRRWKITGPGTVTVVTGNATTKNYGVKFSTAGLYTVQLNDSNCVAQDSLIKTNYIRVINYCQPAVSTLNPDFAIEKTTFGRIDTLIGGTVRGFAYTNSTPAIGTVGYRDNTDKQANYTIGTTNLTKSVEAIIDLGGTFNFSITRNSNYNPANFKMWIDYNQDGTFQSTEQVASSGSMAGKVYNGSITVPQSAAIGNTRMRIGTAFDNQSNTPCGANQYGEFNDYRVRVTPDLTKPVITFVGGDTVFVEIGRNYIDPGFTVTDNVTNPTPFTVSGITSNTQITTHPFSSSYTVTATDASGNVTIRTRIIQSTPDVTKPVITLVGSTPYYVEVKSTYTDSGATASDFYFGNFTPFIVTNSTVNVNKVGTYSVSYNVTDSSGNAATTVVRTVTVGDKQKPVITLSTSDTVYVNVFSAFTSPVVTVTDNYYTGLGHTVSGGPVNTNIIGTYVLMYDAMDSSGNAAVTKKLTVIVRDTKAPTVLLAISDIYVINVNTLTVVPEPGVIIYDNYYPTGVLTVNVNYSNVKLNIIGDYQVRYYVSDPSGNVDSSKVRTYRVVDKVAPVITLTGAGYIVWPRWKPYVDAGNTVTDNYYTGLTCTPDFSKVNIYLPGIYEVKFNITDASGNVAEEKIRLVEITATANGIGNISNNDLFNVYPNPSNGLVNVELYIADANSASIMVFDANGKLVYDNSNVNTNNNKVQIDLSNEAAGMYFIKVVTNNSSISKSFTIQK